MIPYNWEEFICPITGKKEKRFLTVNYLFHFVFIFRKVAKPDFS